MEPTPPDRHALSGIVYGIAAYGMWGLLPLFWKLLYHVSPVELIAHRIVWGFFVFVGLLWARGRMSELAQALRQPRTRMAIAASGLLLATNWLIFIYAIVTDRVLDVSLGYFINPLANVLLGVVFLKERLGRVQIIALVLALAGVSRLAVETGGLPWISLTLAGSFAFYGLVRKLVRVLPLPGSTLEMLLLVPAAAAYLGYLAAQNTGQLGHAGLQTHALLATTGIVTALPLLCFTSAARRLPLWTLGFLQYLAPSLQFSLAVLVYGEPFGAVQLQSFACIWAGLAVLSLYSLYTWRRARK